MGLIDRLISRKPRWELPDNRPQDVGYISKKLDRVIPVPSRSVPDKVFEVNLYQMTCTCPNFRKDRHRYTRRDARRVCPHLLKGLRKEGIEREFSPVLRMILEEGRAYKHFHRLKSTKGDVAFGFQKDAPRIAVYADVHGDTLSRVYNLESRSWSDGPPPNHEPFLLDTIRRVFQLR